MWALENLTPFAAQRAVLQDRDGAKVWVVVVRGTFTIDESGPCPLSPEQQPVRLEPEHRGDPLTSSLRHETDLVVHKPTTDILLRGSAHAPHGRALRELHVRMVVGPVAKELRVTAGQGGRTCNSVPLIYEESWGGPAVPQNPAGTPAPRVMYPEGNARRPAGFGPLAAHWQPRVSLAGTHDRAWRASRFPLPPLDQDPRFTLCAPADQQPPAPLRGGEPVELRNLTPGGVLRFALPDVTILMVTMLDGEEVEHQATLHTVLLEPDRGQVQLVWQSALPCHQTVHRLEKTCIEWEEVVR